MLESVNKHGTVVELVSSVPFIVYVEHGSSAVECRTHNQERPGSNPLGYHFEVWTFLFSPQCPSSLSCINEYLPIDGGGNVSDLVFAHNCCVARMLPRELELVSE